MGFNGDSITQATLYSNANEFRQLEISELLYKVLWLTLVNTFTVGGDPYILEITGERPLVARFIFTPFNKICPVLERWREVFTV